MTRHEPQDSVSTELTGGDESAASGTIALRSEAIAIPSGTIATSADRFATAPISQLIGFQVEPANDAELAHGDKTIGYAVVSLDCSVHHHNPMGRVHGGVIAALADAAMGIAFGRTLLPGEDFSTIDIQVQFVRPVVRGRIRAEAEVVQRGLRIGFVRCQITDRRGKLVATGTSTCTLV